MSSEIPISFPNEFPLLEDDLIYAVTGCNKAGAILNTRETSIQNLRKSLVKLSGVSGVGVHYASGVFSIGSKSQEGNLIDINYSNTYPYEQTISTTGLNLVAGTGIQYQISNTWPYKYYVSQMDTRAVATNVLSHGPTTSSATIVDSGLFQNINWSISNSQPLLNNANKYCYIVELFIKSFTLSIESLPSPESRGRPSTANGNAISWSCSINISPATLTIGMNGNNIIDINPSNFLYYSSSINLTQENIYARYIETRNLNSDIKIQPYYSITPASYSRICNGTYSYWVSTPTEENPNAGHYESSSTSWSDSGILGTTLTVQPYRYLKLDFAHLIT
jgi:hypothetical protein